MLFLMKDCQISFTASCRVHRCRLAYRSLSWTVWLLIILPTFHSRVLENFKRNLLVEKASEQKLKLVVMVMVTVTVTEVVVARFWWFKFLIDISSALLPLFMFYIELFHKLKEFFNKWNKYKDYLVKYFIETPSNLQI